MRKHVTQTLWHYEKARHSIRCAPALDMSWDGGEPIFA